MSADTRTLVRRHVAGAGGASGFIDAVFSSGTYLEMNSTFLSADIVDGCLRGPRDAPGLYRRYDHAVRQSLTLGVLVDDLSHDLAHDTAPDHGISVASLKTSLRPWLQRRDNIRSVESA